MLAGSGRQGRRSGNEATQGDVVACPVARTDAETLSGAVNERVCDTAAVHTDDAAACNKVKINRETVNHSAGEYVRGQVHTNGIESTWSILKRAHNGIYHSWSNKHLHRYVAELTKRMTIRDIPAFDGSGGSGVNMVRWMMAGLSGRTLTYEALTRG